MSSFKTACLVEAKALRVLVPYLEESTDGLVLTNKGRLAKYLQREIGDALFNKHGRVYSVEIKAEQKHTGNIFVEKYSNRNLESIKDHAEHGVTPGWLEKLRADLLFYYFIDTDDLYIFHFYRLKQWCLWTQEKGPPGDWGNLYKYRCRQQGKYKQLNDTWGAVIPLVDLQKQNGGPGYTQCKVLQLPLLDDEQQMKEADT